MAFKQFTLAAVMLSAASASAEALIGAGVGSADTLVSEGSKLFNQKKYPKSAENFLKATRANPTNLQTYVQLARAQMLAGQIQKSCYSYRVFLKAAPDSPERKKAAAEGEQCERKLKGSKKEPADLTQKFVEARAAFFAAIDAGQVAQAQQQISSLVNEGYLSVDLGEMGAKLSAAASAQADDIHARALKGEKMAGADLKAARPLYQTAEDMGASTPAARGRMAFLDGLADLQSKNFKKAESDFDEAAKRDAQNKEYVFYKALTLFQSGDRPGALKALELALPNDPRTHTLGAHQALVQSAEAGAGEIEKLLFQSRFVTEK
jgi:tetratricopeptide (TPR) repeat protein